MTTTIVSNGRLCNQIVRNIAVSLIAEKHDLHVKYSSMDLINDKLGIPLYSGKHIYKDLVVLDDFNYFPILQTSTFLHNLNPNIHYFQSTEISQFINSYLHREDIKTNIMNKNPFQSRYNKNNDLYVHIRLDDAASFNPGIRYYLNAISKIKYDNIYISTDEVNHDIIKQIVLTYPHSTIITYNEVKTIQFASSCKHIILSHGSFSATIGNLAFFSDIYYPKFDANKTWCGDMFNINGWTKLEDF